MDKIKRSILIGLLMIITLSAISFISYEYDQGLASIAAEQVDNDSAYPILRTQNTVHLIFNITRLLVVLVYLRYLYKLFSSE